ncbi:MAG TPA: VIT domain-containing protein [Gemmataceae bacterium]|nr:VIT domain-containing protein [Gemmataceae bacterium]
MRRYLPVAALLLAWAAAAHARGLLIPEDKTVPPLAMLNHKVTIAVEDQVAVTHVEQTFRNHTDRPLEATYVFPLPKGASLDHFSMWVDGKEVKGEIIEASKARDIYTSIVRRSQDPGLLEYLGNNLAQLKVFPIPPHGDQKIGLTFQSIAGNDNGVVEYVYPLKTDGRATATLEDFSITATIKSQNGVANVYSPTHAITLKRTNDREVVVDFDKNQALLDKDFQLYYSTGEKDVGLTILTHRPIASEDGYFTLLLTPKVEMEKEAVVPRDMVLVLDTSGSMRGVKMEQARKALKFCLENLGSKDRFALINFATTVNRYRNELLDATPDQVAEASKWVQKLEATGGTAINDAMAAALNFRSGDAGRSFTIVFFTDGMPTIGETNTDKILANIQAKNTANTRIFTFGVGDDVNATFLDAIADKTRALSSYVRPQEDIEAKVSGLYSKISNPVLTNLKLSATNSISFNEIYPPELPDLFHNNQLIVMGRFNGKGASAVKLEGMVGMEKKEFVYDVTFPDKTKDDHTFVEQLWARRKVGYMLDQIRANGEKKELVDEVVALAKKYGITTPYTSYLIVPDAAVPVAQNRAPDGKPNVSFNAPAPGGAAPPALTTGTGSGGGFGAAGAEKPKSVEDFAKENQTKPGDLETKRGNYADANLDKLGDKGEAGQAGKDAKEKKALYDRARDLLQQREQEGVQAGKMGVDLSLQTANLRNQSRLDPTALKNVNGRNCLEFGGVWIDEGFDAKMPTFTIKAQSDAYFKLLDRQSKMREVLTLGNHLVWVTPNGTALIIDTSTGKETATDAEIDVLFAVKK